MTEWINTIAAVGAFLFSAWALLRTTRKENHGDLVEIIDGRISEVLGRRARDLDERIDERVTLNVASDIAVIKNELAAIRRTLDNVGEHDASLVKNTVDATANAISTAAKSIITATRIGDGR